MRVLQGLRLLQMRILLAELLAVVRQVDYRAGAVGATGGDRVEAHGLALDLLLEHGSHGVGWVSVVMPGMSLKVVLVLVLRVSQRLRWWLVYHLGCASLLMWEQSQVAFDKLLISCVPIHLSKAKVVH